MEERNVTLFARTRVIDFSDLRSLCAALVAGELPDAPKHMCCFDDAKCGLATLPPNRNRCRSCIDIKVKKGMTAEALEADIRKRNAA